MERVSIEFISGYLYSAFGDVRIVGGPGHNALTLTPEVRYHALPRDVLAEHALRPYFGDLKRSLFYETL